jgi:Zn-dependent protease with chaperone function
MEFLGAVAGVLIWGEGWQAYPAALLFAAAGGALSRFFAARPRNGEDGAEYTSPERDPLGQNTPERGEPFQNMPNDPPARIDVNAVRHPRERRVYIIAVLCNLIVLAVLALWIVNEVNLFSAQLSEIAQAREISFEEAVLYETSGLLEAMWYDLESRQRLQLYLSVVSVLLFTVAALEYYYARLKTRAVRVTPRQFGDLYAMAEQYARVLGLKKMPEIYLVQEDGVMNAFASNIIRKRFIGINADLLEVAYREFRDLPSIGFVLAHEMAHIRLRHVAIWVRYSVMLAQLIPVIGPALSRVREYSCDRVAQAVSGSDGIDAMMALTMGKHLYRKTDAAEYLETARTARGFWVWLGNLNASHPILPKRGSALANPARPGRIFEGMPQHLFRLVKKFVSTVGDYVLINTIVVVKPNRVFFRCIY